MEDQAFDDEPTTAALAKAAPEIVSLVEHLARPTRHGQWRKLREHVEIDHRVSLDADANLDSVITAHCRAHDDGVRPLAPVGQLNIDEAHLVAHSPGGSRFVNSGSLADHLLGEHGIHIADRMDLRELLARHRDAHTILAPVAPEPTAAPERAFIDRTNGKIYVLDVFSDQLRRYEGGMSTFSCPMVSLDDVGIDLADLVELTPVQAPPSELLEHNGRPSCRVRLMSTPSAQMKQTSPFTSASVGRAFVLVVDMADDVSEAAHQEWKTRAADMGASALIFEAGMVHLD